jgi:hypothetical protein
MEFIKQNKTITHIASELVCVVVLVMYISRNNAKIYKHMKMLEEKVFKYEEILKSHEEILSKLIGGKSVSFREPISDTKIIQPQPPQQQVYQQQPQQVYQQQPQQQPQQQLQQQLQQPQQQPIVLSPVQNQVVVAGDDVEVNCVEDMDEEIKQELSKLNLIKDN